MLTHSLFFFVPDAYGFILTCYFYHALLFGSAHLDIRNLLKFEYYHTGFMYRLGLLLFLIRQCLNFFL